MTLHTVPCDIDATIVARLSALPEARVLDYFWLMVWHGRDRLALLVELAAVEIERPASWNRGAVREAFEQSRPLLNLEQCFGCYDTNRKHQLHHVIEIQHGGSNTARNLVPLCFDCHQYVHPWLKELPPPPPPEGRFESLWQILCRVRKR